LPEDVLAIVDKAPRYPAGRGVRIEVRNKKSLGHVKLIAGAKMSS
jgi:hypothetical protein